MTEYEYTIEIGYDAHVHAGYASYVTSTPEEALELRGTKFHPECDSVVRREVGTHEWTYHREDQKYNFEQKMSEYEAAAELRKQVRERYRPKKTSALPNNRRVRTRSFTTGGYSPHIWRYVHGKLDIEATTKKAEI